MIKYPLFRSEGGQHPPDCHAFWCKKQAFLRYFIGPLEGSACSVFSIHLQLRGYFSVGNPIQMQLEHLFDFAHLFCLSCHDLDCAYYGTILRYKVNRTKVNGNAPFCIQCQSLTKAIRVAMLRFLVDFRATRIDWVGMLRFFARFCRK
jgi:hypothetical protein